VTVDEAASLTAATTRVLLREGIGYTYPWIKVQVEALPARERQEM